MNIKNKLSNLYNTNLFILSLSLLLIVLIALTTITYYFHATPLAIFGHTFILDIPLTTIMVISIPLFSMIMFITVETKRKKDYFFDLFFLNFAYKNVDTEDENLVYIILGILVYMFTVNFLDNIDLYSLVIIFGTLLTVGLSFSLLSFNYMISDKVSKDKMFLATNRFSMATVMVAYMVVVIVFMEIVLIPIMTYIFPNLLDMHALNPSLVGSFTEYLLGYLLFILYNLLSILVSMIMISFVRDLFSGMKEFLSEIVVFRFQCDKPEDYEKLVNNEIDLDEEGSDDISNKN